jgi:hypothetical protein
MTELTMRQILDAMLHAIEETRKQFAPQKATGGTGNERARRSNAKRATRRTRPAKRRRP